MNRWRPSPHLVFSHRQCPSALTIESLEVSWRGEWWAALKDWSRQSSKPLIGFGRGEVPAFRKVSPPRLLCRGNKVPLCSPVSSPIEVRWSPRSRQRRQNVASQQSDAGDAWMSLRRCPEQCSTEACLIKCLIQLQSHYKRMWPTTLIGGVLSCRATLYCSDRIN